MGTLGLKGKFFIKHKNEAYMDVVDKFDGIKILSIEGINDIGEATNIYHEQWIDSDKEDVCITTYDEEEQDYVVVRKNTDINLTFIVSPKYATITQNFNTRQQHDSFIDYMCNSGEVFIRTAYEGKEAHCIALEGYKPTTIKLQRGRNSFILGTITLHNIEKTQTSS